MHPTAARVGRLALLLSVAERAAAPLPLVEYAARDPGRPLPRRAPRSFLLPARRRRDRALTSLLPSRTFRLRRPVLEPIRAAVGSRGERCDRRRRRHSGSPRGNGGSGKLRPQHSTSLSLLAEPAVAPPLRTQIRRSRERPKRRGTDALCVGRASGQPRQMPGWPSAAPQRSHSDRACRLSGPNSRTAQPGQ
jgi:hypothetical protein